MRRFLVSSATLFGLGKRFPAPGTIGTIATIPLAVLLLWMGPLWHMFVVLGLVPVAIVAAELYEKQNGGHDPKEIIIDEVVGFLITMVWLPLTWQSVAMGFALFRLFDIWKPFPISRIDQKIPGGVGTIADDLAAGLAANILLQLMLTYTSWLGVQNIIISNS